MTLLCCSDSLLGVYTTRASIHVAAPRAAVYAALTSAEAIQHWRAPDDMTAVVHEFDASEGGAFRVSLSYRQTDRTGKTEANTDTYHGRFARLVPDEQVVEEVEFESADPALAGTITMTTTLTDAEPGSGSGSRSGTGPGTDVVLVHDGVPDAVPPADNELGVSMALANLAAYVEHRSAGEVDCPFG